MREALFEAGFSRVMEIKAEIGRVRLPMCTPPTISAARASRSRAIAENSHDQVRVPALDYLDGRGLGSGVAQAYSIAEFLSVL